MKIFALSSLATVFSSTVEDLCPSTECWQLNEVSNLCELKDPMPTPCFTVSCTDTHMTVRIKHTLFGTEDGQDAFEAGGPVFTSDGWDATTPGYFWTKPLSEVDVDVINAPLVDDPSTIAEHVQFLMSASSKPIESPIAGVILKPRSPMVYWECRYVAQIDVPNFAFTLEKATADGSSVAYGNFLSGFNLKVFTDEARTQEVVGQNTLFIGSRAYAQTEWLTPVSTLDYFITDCVVKQGNTEVSIIRDNCYSKTLGAKMSQSTHRVSVKSLFDWITFSSNTYQEHQETVTCSLKVCKTTSPACDPSLTCPTTAGYGYSFDGTA